MLSEGSSKVWTEPFQQLTGETRMSAQPLMDYFQPLMTYLKEVNGEDVGWQSECLPFRRSSSAHRPLPGAAALLLLACLAALRALL